MIPMPAWRRFDKHVVFLAASLACANTGKSMAAKIAMIAMTTSNSIRVKAFWFRMGRSVDLSSLEHRFEDMMSEHFAHDHDHNHTGSLS